MLFLNRLDSQTAYNQVLTAPLSEYHDTCAKGIDPKAVDVTDIYLKKIQKHGKMLARKP